MEQFSQILVVAIIIPVLLQIVLPLTMLAIYGLYRAGKSLFGWDDFKESAVDPQVNDEKLQPSRA